MILCLNFQTVHIIASIIKYQFCFLWEFCIDFILTENLLYLHKYQFYYYENIRLLQFSLASQNSLVLRALKYVEKLRLTAKYPSSLYTF